MNSKVEVNTNIYQITDKAGNKLDIDINTGLIYRYKDNERVLCNTVDTSEKRNGYLYCPIVINTKKGQKLKTYSQHGIIAMLAYTDEFDSLLDKTSKIVPNHKDNCPWNNKPENLEWTTDRLNGLHGKLVNSMWCSRHYINSMTHRDWTEIKHNQSTNDYVTLKLPISVKELEEYELHIGKKLKSYWGLQDEYDRVPDYKILEFIKWLDKKHPTPQRQIRNYDPIPSKIITFDDVVKPKAETKIPNFAAELFGWI